MSLPITATVSSKNRYDILSHCLMSIALQINPPSELIIFDDSDQKVDLRNNPIYFNIFKIFERKNIQWRVEFGKGVGQVANHQKSIEISKYDWIWRLDDDNVAESDCLQKLYSHTFDNEVGAIGGVVLHPDIIFPSEATSVSIKEINLKYAVQFYKFDGIQKVEHLYSTFLFKKSCDVNYNLNLSPAGHREETLFTHEVFRRGFKLLVDGSAITWHCKAPTGGIRSYNGNPEYWARDEKVFQDKLKEWNINPFIYKLIYLDNGIGDHYAFRHILPEIKEKYPNDKIIISACYPDVFFDEKDVEIVHLDAGKIFANGNVDRFNVYKLGYENQRPLIQVFREIYL